MAVSRNHKGQRQLIRHSLRPMFANNQDVGKGLYIGGSDGHPSYRHRHHHHDTSSSSGEAADATTTPDSKGWVNRLPTRQDIYRSDSQRDDREWRDMGTGDTFSQLDVYSPRKSVIQPSTPSILPSSSSSSVTLSSILSKNDEHHFSSSHKRLPQSSWSHAGPGHPRHRMSPLSSAHSPGHHFPPRNRSIQSSPSSSSSLSSLPSPNSHLLNLGQSSTLHPLHHNHLGSRLDPLPTTWDLAWNQSDTLCFNRTNASCDTWDLFDPDENDTSRPASVNIFDEEYRFWTLVLIIIPLLTVFGNVLVVMSVIKERSLKTVTNYFICSLAVADIMVAVIVMPFAVYMEVMKYRWLLHDGLCDAWVASDVLGCTASILNLTAICVDRFIAVTQPIKYAKHKNSKRVFIMLAVTWVVSVAIAAPIALGVNYSSARNSGDCQFFNSDFIIYSSMGSFYIPSVIMCFLYWKIYRVIRMRALKAKMAKQMREVDKKTLQGVIENPTNVANQNANDTGGVYGAAATVTTGLANVDNGRVTTYNTTKATTSRMLISGGDEDKFGNNPQSNSDDNSDDDDDDDTPSGSGSANNNTPSKDHKKLGVASVVMQISPRFYRSMEAAELITNPMAEELDRLENEGFHAVSQYGKNGGCVGGLEPSASTSGGTGQPCANEAETPFTAMLGKADAADQNVDVTTGKNATTKVSTPTRGSQKKGVTKFNFHMRPSRKRKEKSSSRREKKATKTLAIVLGVFLACWVPFFTLNIFNAICIRYDLNDLPSCKVDPIFFSLFQWLGYINSFLNPVIYTIFNQEFRKAFRRLLTEPCR